MTLHAGRIVRALLALGLMGAASGPLSGGFPGKLADPAPGSLSRPPGPAACRGPEPGTPLPVPGRLTRPPAVRGGLDVLHYDLRLDLRGAAEGRLRGEAALGFRVPTGTRRVQLDLVGLRVDSVRLDGRGVACEHDGAVLSVALPAPEEEGAREKGEESRGVDGTGEAAGNEHRLVVFYGGKPADGLVFGRDDRGGPTVFADNWPNRARWWFPSNDHPSDKATVRFTVLPPEGREVVANGRRVGRGGGEGTGRPARDGGAREGVGGADGGAWEVTGAEPWIWETVVPIPVYTMVVGVADFGVAPIGEAACGLSPLDEDGCADLSLWALPGDSTFGVERFRRAPEMLDHYARLFGPFPYEKLAHVESATRFGGMENAGAVFYARAPWESREMGESVIAHETVHQWFGDAVTPATWAHLWVSEGFATYFDYLYYRHAEGEARFRERLEEARRSILASDVNHRPVVDTAAVDLYGLLNSNSYQKGAWFLHMLRRRVGETVFFEGVRRYYREHRHGTATTADVRRAMEEVSGLDLSGFFEQWLRRPGHPVLSLEWREEEGAVLVTVRQRQPASRPVFRLETELEVVTAVDTLRCPVRLASRTHTVRIPIAGRVEGVRIDPDGWLLHEEAGPGRSP